MLVLQLLLTMSIISFFAYAFYKYKIYKTQAAFWKDSCFIMAEKYNDLLVKHTMNEALDRIDINRDTWETKLN